VTGKEITDAINADPAEVQRLRDRLRQLAEGRRSPWRRETS